jgi:biopolymer transport protein ExbD
MVNINPTFRKFLEKSFVILIVFLSAFILLSGVSLITKPKKGTLNQTPEEQMIKNQLAGLDRLKGDTKPYTENDISNQIKELEKMGSTRQKSLSADEIKRQIEALNELKTN